MATNADLAQLDSRKAFTLGPRHLVGDNSAVESVSGAPLLKLEARVTVHCNMCHAAHLICNENLDAQDRLQCPGPNDDECTGGGEQTLLYCCDYCRAAQPLYRRNQGTAYRYMALHHLLPPLPRNPHHLRTLGRRGDPEP
jgi:hypothetical protein